MDGFALRSHTKKWPSVFLQDRDYKGNRPYIEEIRGIIGENGDEIAILLEDVEKQIPTCKIEEVKNFCEGASLVDLISGTSPETQREDAWLDERSFPHPTRGSSERDSKNPASATTLLAMLEESVLDEENTLDVDRRLIYIQNLNPYFILALLKTASFHQVSVLRDAIWKHLAFQTSLRVRIPARGFISFHLELHLPCFAFRTCPPPADHHPKAVNSRPPRKWTDLSFLEIQASNSEDSTNCGILETHSSFVIWGTDNHHWVAYAFAHTEYDDESLGDKIVPYDGAHVDPISEAEAKLPIWDAREYFLKVFQLRISQMLDEWEGLILPVKRSIDEYRERHPSTLSHLSVPTKYRVEDVKRAFDWTWKTIDLLRQQREALSGTIKFWERFNSANGDIGYFSDTDSSDPVQHQIGLSLHAIEETFETMEDLQRKLDVLHESCRDSADALKLRLNIESNNAAQYNGSTSFLTVLIIAPIALAAAYFSMPEAMVVFQPNSKSFIIVAFILMVAIRLIFVICETLPGFLWWWKAFFALTKIVKLEGEGYCVWLSAYGSMLVPRRDRNYPNRNTHDVERGTLTA